MTKITGDRDSVFGYTGHFWHGPSGLWLTKYRAYDPNNGRWISRDPIAEKDGLNLYSYVRSNPINHIDLLGLSGASASVGSSSGWGMLSDALKKANNWKDKMKTYSDWLFYYVKCHDLLNPDPIDPFKNQPTCPTDDPSDDDKEWKKKQDDFLKERIQHAFDCWKPFMDKYLGGGYGGYGH